jgi:hypothetical protein
MTFAVARMFSVPLSPTEEEHGAQQLERIVGLRSGRGGLERDLSDVSMQPQEWPTDIGSLAKAVSAASSERIEFARRGVELAVCWMPALRSTFTAAFGVSVAPLTDILEEWTARLTPETYALMFSVFVSNALERATNDQIREALDTFHSELFALAMLEERPESEWDVVGQRLRPYERLRFEQLRAGLGGDLPEVAAR